MLIQGANNPGNFAHVDNDGRLSAKAVASTLQAHESISGKSFNINTGQITLTDANETPILFVKNDAIEQEILIPRFFVTLLSSTGGSGPVSIKFSKNATGGTLVDSGTDVPLSNFNFGSGQTISATAKKGTTGDTVTGDDSTNFELLFPSDNQRSLTEFEAIVLPRGSSIVVSITPPAGNTSMIVECGFNVYLNE